MKNKTFNQYKSSISLRVLHHRSLVNIWAAFTLIELLVVISIIALIVAISLFGIQNARKTSRDTKRKTDLEQIRSALELYKADIATYPLTAQMPTAGSPLVGVGGTYLQSVPADILPTQKYYYSSDGSTYTLCASLENSTAAAPSGCTGNVCDNNLSDSTTVTCVDHP